MESTRASDDTFGVSPASGKAPAPEEIILSAEKLSVKYGSQKALDSISFSVKKGEIFALIGSNGAGKSTFLSCVSRQIRSYSGSLKIFGKEVKNDREAVLSSVAIVPQEYSFFSEFTVYENLIFACNIFNLSGDAAKQKANSLISEYMLDTCKNTRAKNLSGGYKRLLNIAISVVKDPKIVLLDEPTAGLDVRMRNLINKAIKRFRAKGITILLTTHYMEDVEEVSDRAAFLSIGKILMSGRLDELIASKGGPYVIILSDIKGSRKKVFDAIGRLEDFEKIVPLDDKIYLVASQEKISDAIAELSSILSSKEVRIGKIDIHEPSLNKVFLGINR